ncbi:MAG: hypothetical protein LBK44_02175 [Spirochaetales bacterium]|nr:hypothetical protein [Spirochaetales bacterium]
MRFLWAFRCNPLRGGNSENQLPELPRQFRGRIITNGNYVQYNQAVAMLRPCTERSG